jgi:hypothetical protein
MAGVCPDPERRCLVNPRLIHVRCTDTGAWTVHTGDREPAVSVHGSET